MGLQKQTKKTKPPSQFGRLPFRLDAERDNLKLGLYGDYPEETIREALGRKIWITNSPLGWSEVLDRILKEHYRL